MPKITTTLVNPEVLQSESQAPDRDRPKDEMLESKGILMIPSLKINITTGLVELEISQMVAEQLKKPNSKQYILPTHSYMLGLDMFVLDIKTKGLEQYLYRVICNDTHNDMDHVSKYAISIHRLIITKPISHPNRTTIKSGISTEEYVVSFGYLRDIEEFIFDSVGGKYLQ